ncbi:MAG: hypothetical protein MRY83_08390, partial [Flavobacteriales bacterium]|nr:hypothetical protein [Flavobacteriales bacterium]
MKKNLFKALMSFVLQMSVLFNAYTQPNQQEYVSFPSPNAGNLGVYGEIPVGHFTGVPNIDVPLHTINSGDISLPISMSYHVGSVKPNVHPSWVGLGWTLMAGGSITRKQNGTIDELKTSANSNLPNYEVGYYYRQNHVFQYSPQLDYFIPEYLLAGFNGFKYDPSPDEFHFNFLGYSGSFMLNEQFEWEVFSDDPIKIEFNPVTDMVKPDSLPNQLLNYKGAGTGQSYLNHYNYDNCNQYFFRFTLITPDGIRYTFGGKNAIEYNVSYYNGPTAFPVPVTWHLTKIEDVNGKLVKLKYDYEDFVCDLSRNRSYRKGYYETSGGNIQMTFLGLVGQYYEVDCTSAEGEANVLYNGIEKIQAQLILPSYLDVIEYEGGEVEFNNSISEELRFDENYLKFVNYMDQHPITGEPIKPINHSDNMIYFDHWNDLQWRKLDKISIKSLGQYKGFTFNYINTPDERLKLGSIQEEGRSSGTGAFYATKPAFEFTYNDLMLPDHYLSDDIDHWGYYNGWRAVNEFNFLWPNPDPTASMHGMNIEDWSKLYYQSRETQSYNYPGAPKNYNMAEVLEKIQYPTGGYCEFNFELNKYSQVVNESRSELEGIENWISGVNRPPCEMYPTIGSHWTPDEVTTDPQNLKYRFEMIKCSSDDYSNAN